MADLRPLGGEKQVQGDYAHDVADGGNPVKVGGKATDYTTGVAAVAVADRAQLPVDRHGVPWYLGGHPKAVRLTANYTAAQTDTILQAVATNERFVVTEVSAFVSNATTVNVQVLFEIDDAADVRFSEHPGIAPGSGYVEGNGGGILAVGVDGGDVLVTCTDPTGGSVTVAVSGFIASD